MVSIQPTGAVLGATVTDIDLAPPVPPAAFGRILHALGQYGVLRFRYSHDWNENDLLIRDHLGTIHRAIADYGPDEIRLLRCCQVTADKVFDPGFPRPAMAAAI